MSYTGIVKFFNEKNKFGFIIEDETKKEYYFNVSGFEENVKDGDQVTFNLQEQKRGSVCLQIRKIVNDK